jgi:hypothetical protein
MDYSTKVTIVNLMEKFPVVVFALSIAATAEDAEKNRFALHGWGAISPARGVVVDDTHVFAVAKKGLTIHPKQSFKAEKPLPSTQLALKGIPQAIVLLNENHVIVGIGRHLAIVEVSDRANPKLLTEFRIAEEDLNGCETMTLRGKALYVASRRQGMLTVDLSDPSKPKITSRTKLPGITVGIALAGDVACVAVETGVVFLDISGKQPKQISFLDTIRSAWGIDVSGDRAVVSSANYLFVIDISDPKQPSVLREGVITAPFWYAAFRDVKIRNHLAYLSSGEGGLYIYDWSSGQKCTVVAQMGFWGSGRKDKKSKIEYVKKFGIAATDEEAEKFIPQRANYYMIAIGLAIDGKDIYVLGHDGKTHCMRFTPGPSPVIDYISVR